MIRASQSRPVLYLFHTCPPTLLIAEQQGSEVFAVEEQLVGKVLADGRNKAKAYLDSYTGNTITEDMRLRLWRLL